MIPLKTLIVVLLIEHIASVVFIAFVLRRQWGLLRLPIAKPLRHFRLVLFGLALAILIGNFIPIVIDILTFFVNTGRPRVVRPASIAYALSNGTIQLIAAYLIWTLYQLAADTKSISDYSQSRLEAENSDLRGR